ncbi:ATP-binding cassette sub-family g member 5 [Plakobranchus ocellatus]|uniref:ATP-binding cassette sub-family g member 5 n=1 Tax=Plakobranchus ocellatus TaxID=259542 RepID=A0AAV4BM81_9GAST|nr:ATP-binding cassette sub-family g member 5 [Plakobranchus ocellatus]
MAQNKEYLVPRSHSPLLNHININPIADTSSTRSDQENDLGFYQKASASAHGMSTDSRQNDGFQDDSSRNGPMDCVSSQSTAIEASGNVDKCNQHQQDECNNYTKPRLDVNNLTYTIRATSGHWWSGNLLRPARRKQVLKNVSMSFKRGEINAIVGTSGSGKTSLLDVISGRAEGQVDGVVSYKHEQCTRAMMRQKASYVIQADRLLPTLTVRETLTYMAFMKLPGKLSFKEIDQKVQKVIIVMGLLHVADSRIGGAVIRGVSGGEKRRITIGVQLLKDPEILLLDEPTSGLDSFTARHLVSTLRNLAHEGDKLVLISIHQARSDIFNTIDRVAILTDGQLAYLGPPSQMVPYFTSIGYPCPKHQNPCDVYTDLTSVDRRTLSREAETSSRAKEICEAYETSELRQNMIENKNIHSSAYRYHDNSDATSSAQADGPSWLRIFLCLLERMNVHLWRERTRLLGRIFQHAFFVPFMILYIGRVDNDMGGIQDRMGLLYQTVQTGPYIALTNVVAIFPVLRETFYRETHDGLYSTATFLTAYFVHALPFNIISSTLFSTFLYWVVGFKADLLTFGMFVLVTVIMAQFGEMISVGFLGVIRSVQLACDSTALLFNTLAFFGSGLIRSLATMPLVLKRIGYICIQKYSTEILVGNEFHNLQFDCDNEPGVCATGNDFLASRYPGVMEHVTRNFIIIGGYSVLALGVAIVMFKARKIPTLY